MTTQQTQVEPNEAWGMFCGGIDAASVGRILASIATASQNGITRLHVLFQSSGGSIGDGVALYYALKTCPFPVTLYNVGAVMSVAVVAYLGAPSRKTSAHAIFNLHRSTFSPQGAPAGTLESLAEAVLLEDKRTEAILREHLNLTDKQWKDVDRYSAGLWLSAEEAVAVGLSTEIADFAPPFGSKVYYL